MRPAAGSVLQLLLLVALAVGAAGQPEPPEPREPPSPPLGSNVSLWFITSWEDLTNPGAFADL